MLDAAKFWISLLEGEQLALKEEAAKHRQRQQLSLKQQEKQASTIRELEGERHRLREANARLQESRDEAICERHFFQQRASELDGKVGDNAEASPNRAGALQVELQREREAKRCLEDELVKVKVGKFDLDQRIDGMAALIEYYEDELLALNATFEPVDARNVGQWMPPLQPVDRTDLDSIASDTVSTAGDISKSRRSSVRRNPLKGLMPKRFRRGPAGAPALPPAMEEPPGLFSEAPAPLRQEQTPTSQPYAFSSSCSPSAVPPVPELPVHSAPLPVVTVVGTCDDGLCGTEGCIRPGGHSGDCMDGQANVIARSGPEATPALVSAPSTSRIRRWETRSD